MWIIDPVLEMDARLGAPGPGDAPLRRASGCLHAFEGKLEAERDRLALWLAVGLGAGILLYFALPAEPPLALGLGFCVAAVLLVTYGHGRRLLFEGGSIFVLALAIGFLCGEIRTRMVAAPVLAHATAPVWIEGELVSLDAGTRGGQKALLRVTSLERLPREAWPLLVRISIHGAPVTLRSGAHIRLRAKLMPPAGPSAPGAYDFAQRAFFQGIGAVGYALTVPEVLPAPPQGAGFDALMSAVERAREDLSARVARRLEGPVSGVAVAFTTGLRTEIPKDAETALRNSGLYHLISISGVHMSAIAVGLFFSLRFALAAIPPIALRFPIKKWAAGLSILGAFAYLIFTGSSVPTVRSFVMVALVFLAVIADRRALTMRNVALSAALILIFIPESMLDVSFQMSYAATVALIAAYEEWTGRHPEGGALARIGPYIGGLVLTGLVAGLATAPFSLFHFQTATPLSLIANLGAIPVTDLVVMPAAFAIYLLAPLGWEGPAVWVLGEGCAILLWVAGEVAALPGAVQGVAAGAPAALGLITLGGLWLTFWRTAWRRFAIIPILAGIALWGATRGPELLIDAKAETVALRGPSGHLGLIFGSARSYATQNWLRRAGLPAGSPAPKAEDRRCDALGCVAPLADGGLVAVSRDPASLADDCAAARIVISTGVVRVPCSGPALIIDRHMLSALGAIAVSLDADGPKLVPASIPAGSRPWAPARPSYAPRIMEPPAPAPAEPADEPPEILSSGE
jgi:competence protein ComEC